MFKKNGGFTLVELIVVIAILAILAGIGVPSYSKYIANANDAKAKAASYKQDLEAEIAKASLPDLSNAG